MGVVDKAGSAYLSLASVNETPSNGRAFDLDFHSLAQGGFYQPGAQSGQLARELRAIKKRLLRRIGYLRASGERQAFGGAGRRRNLIMVTSCRAGEGKSFCAINLALSLALEDAIPTLLVDADGPRPKVRSHFGLPAGRGLADSLKDGMADPGLSPEALCVTANQGPLSILGEGAAQDDYAALYASEPARRFWTALGAGAPDRLAVIDAPPVLATAEAVILAKFVDEIVFVVEANETPEPAVAAALDELLDVNANVSLILNRCLIGAGGSHYDSYQSYGREDGAKSDEGRRQ